jgi:hypothetical protein
MVTKEENKVINLIQSNAVHMQAEKVVQVSVRERSVVDMFHTLKDCVLNVLG